RREAESLGRVPLGGPPLRRDGRAPRDDGVPAPRARRKPRGARGVVRRGRARPRPGAREMTTASLAKEGGVAIPLFASPGESVNVVSSAFLDEVAALFEDAARDRGIVAGVMAGGTPDEFLAGADLHEFLAMSDPAEGEALSRKAQSLLLGIERGGKPW